MNAGPKRVYKLKRSPADSRDVLHPGSVAGSGLRAAQPPPPSVDLRPEMPHVLDQSTLGSCALNAASNCMRHLLTREHKAEFQPSRLYMYWNTRVSVEGSPPDEDTGVCIRDVCKAIQQYHVCGEDVWPYDIAKFSVAPPLEAFKAADTHKAIKYAFVPQSIGALKRTLASGLPIMLGVQLYASFESQEVARTGMVPMPKPDDEECLGGHAVLLVGYDDASETFLVMNSWGTGWGQGGYFRIPYAYVLDPALASDFWVLTFFA
jgi:C1A family cysteine protease